MSLSRRNTGERVSERDRGGTNIEKDIHRHTSVYNTRIEIWECNNGMDGSAPPKKYRGKKRARTHTSTRNEEFLLPMNALADINHLHFIYYTAFKRTWHTFPFERSTSEEKWSTLLFVAFQCIRNRRINIEIFVVTEFLLSIIQFYACRSKNGAHNRLGEIFGERNKWNARNINRNRLVSESFARCGRLVWW